MAIASARTGPGSYNDNDETVQLASGVATVVGKGTKTLQPESGDTGTLTQVTGLAFGEKGVLFADAGKTITVQDNANVVLTRDLSIPLTGDNNITVIGRGSGIVAEVSRSIN